MSVKVRKSRPQTPYDQFNGRREAQHVILASRCCSVERRQKVELLSNGQHLAPHVLSINLCIMDPSFLIVVGGLRYSTVSSTVALWCRTATHVSLRDTFHIVVIESLRETVSGKSGSGIDYTVLAYLLILSDCKTTKM